VTDSRRPATEQEASSGLWSRAFVTLCLVFFLNAFFVAPFTALFAVYLEADLHRLPWFSGSLRGLLLALGGVFAVMGGRLCDLLGRKNTLLIGMSGAVLTGLVFRTGNAVLLTALILVIGATSGPWSTAGQSYLIASVAGRHLGVGGALYFLTNTAGGALGSLVTGLVKQRWTFGSIGGAMTVAMAASLGLAAWLLPGSRERAETRDAGPQGLALWSAYRPLVARRAVQLLVGLRYLVTSFWGMATLAIPLLVFRASQKAGLPAPESTAAYYAAVSLSVATACQLAAGLLADRYNRTVPLLVAATGVVLSAMGLALFWARLTGLFACGTALTASAWAVSTLIPKLMNEMANPGEKSRLVGLGHLVWSAAMLTGSVVGGMLLGIDPALPFVVGAVLASGGTACAWRLCTLLDRKGP